MFMISKFKYLHEVSAGNIWLSHHLLPEVSAMLAAMSSRAPIGGVRARYSQLVTAVLDGLWSDRIDPNDPCWDEAHFRVGHREIAEERLTTYPLHPKVQKFFDDFVGAYGHSSILELTG